MNEGLIYGQSFFVARIFRREGGALVCRRLDVMSAACRREVEGALRGILPRKILNLMFSETPFRAV